MARILVVDDIPLIREYLRTVLESFGHEVFESEDGLGAETVVKETEIDLMLLDIHLPGQDGIQTLANIRKSSCNKELPVIVITGNPAKDKVIDIAKLGISGFLAKPIRMESITDKILEVLFYKENFENFNVLVVDDSEFARKNVFRELSHIRDSLTEAKDGAEALKLIYENKYDLVLLDIEMPVKSGIDVLREIREKGNSTPVMMISSLVDDSTIQRCEALGIEEYLTKPFKSGDLKTKVMRMIYPERGDGPEPKILIVDDTRFLRYRVRADLKPITDQVQEAADGKEAVQLFRQVEFDLVFLDIDMPVLDGIKTLQALKAIHPDTPVVMITAMAGDKDKAKCLELGADDYITKPFSSDELKRVALQILKKKKRS